MLKAIFTCFALSLAGSTVAQQTGNHDSVIAVTQGDACPEPDKKLIEDLCIYVYDQREDYDPESEFAFRYERSLWNLACLDPQKNTREEAKVRIRNMWAKYHDCFKCNATNFPIINGSILKYSLNFHFTAFLSTLVKVYHVDINYIDPADGKTLLDFAKEKIDTAPLKGIDNPAVLQAYNEHYRMLRSWGARHSYEISKKGNNN